MAVAGWLAAQGERNSSEHWLWIVQLSSSEKKQHFTVLAQGSAVVLMKLILKLDLTSTYLLWFLSVRIVSSSGAGAVLVLDF